MNAWFRTASLAAAMLLSACQTLPGPTRAPAPAADAAPASAPAPVAEAPPAQPLPTYLIPEPDTPRNGGELFDRLEARLADATCPRDHLVQRWQGIYARSPARFAAQIENVLPLMALALDEAERYRLPGELVLLPIVESWYRPDAGIGSGHVGLWQFGAPTARGLGLAVRSDYDARMAPFAATDAAFRHLADLHNDFGDWKLANMGFNAGAYRVRKILDAQPSPPPISPEDRKPPGLSSVTYEHLAKVQALACLLAQPSRFKLELPREVAIEGLTTVTLPAGASTLSAIAAATQLDAAQLQRLNPAFRRGVVTAQAGRELLLPRAAAPRFDAFTLPQVAATALAQAGTGSGVHVIRNGDTLGAIARRYKLRLRDLLAWNSLGAGAILRPGQRIRLEP